MASKYIKKNRIFSPVKKYAWLFIFLVAFGGLWYPKLGLLMLPMMGILAVMGFFSGKAWCGKFCPHGSLFDGLIMPLSLNRKIPSFLRSKVTIVLAFTFFMFMLGSRVTKVFGLWGTASFVDRLGYVFVFNYLAVTIVGTALAILISPRAWCSFCPMGTFQLLTYKAGKLTRLNRFSDKAVTMKAPEACTNCNVCSSVCPMQLSPRDELSENNCYESQECIRCSVCVRHCPTGALCLSSQSERAHKKNEVRQGEAVS